MTKPQVKIVNAETGEEVIRDMNAEELAQWEIDKANLLAKQQTEESAAQAKETAQAKLAALGLTVNDLKALGL
jgi:hypothetical protein